MSILKELARIGNGIRSGVSDVPSLVTNILELDVHGVVTDTRKIAGDAGDVLTGAANLGIEMGSAPLKFTESLTKWADSPVLSGAQLIIEGEKKLTGSGDIEAGGDYSTSASKLEEAVITLIGAELDRSGWDGRAADSYDEISQAHRRLVSRVQVADSNIGRVIKEEAEQVRQTREVLESTSQWLYDYGLATKAVLAVPGANVAKVLLADRVAASAALANTTFRMLMMANNSRENASYIRNMSDHYSKAQEDTSGSGAGCGPFVDPKDDRQESLPTRAKAESPYTPRDQEPVYGPPAAPLPVESQVPRTYDLPADLPVPHITPPLHPPAGLPK
ncbi:EspA/EspE family type VII secretion system effector [Mycobacterium syngnathidarum]|uniref:EspA/EspE family type VII secretion system effector n=1 Tax=Mycobacterium syngnathidarum TaxID=1908205 RepID=UPI001055A2E8|nr:EspA/EspE family type VII secretion system effector [Mycobacterium syngnathidarum]